MKSKQKKKNQAIRKSETTIDLIMDTPIGRMIATASNKGICQLTFADSLSQTDNTPLLSDASTKSPAAKHLQKLKQELQAYFQGQLKKFTVALDLRGTSFQLKAWKQLLKIPYGTTWAYLRQATVAGCPKSVRAIAQANRRNPVAIVVPCHRVIGADGRLTGYDGGLWRKQFLLDMEKRVVSG